MSERQIYGLHSPPVKETAMAVEFAPVPRLDTTALVHLLDSLSEDYPERSDQPPLPPSPRPDEMSEYAPQMFGIGSLTPRLWAVNSDLGYVLQLQQDRIILNWRDVGGKLYPGFETLQDEFEQKWIGILTFCQDFGLSAPAPHIVEFTYVNGIGQAGNTRLMRALRFLDEIDESLLPGSLAGVTLSTQRIVSDERYQGMISIDAAHYNRPEWLLTITTRLSVGEANPLDALARAHELGRTAFFGVTTQEAQEQWGPR